MKCPKCKSTNTKKVSVIRKDWRMGHQQCLDCHHKDHWNHFCDPPLLVQFSNINQMILPDIDGYI